MSYPNISVQTRPWPKLGKPQDFERFGLTFRRPTGWPVDMFARVIERGNDPLFRIELGQKRWRCPKSYLVYSISPGHPFFKRMMFWSNYNIHNNLLTLGLITLDHPKPLPSGFNYTPKIQVCQTNLRNPNYQKFWLSKYQSRVGQGHKSAYLGYGDE